MTKRSSQGFSKPILVVFLFFPYHNMFMYFVFVPYFMNHIHVECCILTHVLAFVSYSIICWKEKEKNCFMYFDLKKQKIFFGTSSWLIIYIIYMGLRHFYLRTSTRDSWILKHSLWSINQASTHPAVGVGCCQHLCTIVGLAEEPPFDKHDKCLFPVYQMIRLCA